MEGNEFELKRNINEALIEFNKQGKTVSELIDSLFARIDEITADREENINTMIQRMLES